MTKPSSIQLDLFDKDSIRTATVDLAKIIEERKRELAELEQKYAQLRAWAGLAKPKPAVVGTTERTPSTQDSVVQVLKEQVRPMNTAEVMVYLDTDVSRKTVNWALWNAEREGAIQRITGRKGFYAALEYKPSENGDGSSVDVEHPLSGDSTSKARSEA